MTTVVHGSTYHVPGAGYGTKVNNRNIWDDASGVSPGSTWDYAYPSTAPTGNMAYKTPAQLGRGLPLPHNHVTKYMVGCHQPNANEDFFNGRVVLIGVDFNQVLGNHTRWEWYHLLDPGWTFASPASINNHKWYGISIGSGSPYADGHFQWYLEYRGSTDFSGIDVQYQWHTNDDASGVGLQNYGNFGYYDFDANPFTDWIKKSVHIKWSNVSNGGFIKGECNYLPTMNDTGYNDAYSGTARSHAIEGYSGNRGTFNNRLLGDVYYDHGPNDGAFYLTNNAVWANATVKEVQPYIKANWTATGVDLICNAGRLPNGTVYLHFRSDVNGNQGPIGSFTLAAGGDVTDPTCTITSPTSTGSYATSTAALNVSGTAADDVGVVSVTWATDRGASGTATGTTAWNFNVTLSPGTNVITVTAHDAAGHVGNKTITVVLTIDLWTDDFEIDRIASYFQSNDDSGNFVRSTAVPFEGSYSLRSVAQVGLPSDSTRLVGFGKMPAAGFYAFSPVDAGIKNYPYIKLAFYHRADSGWLQTTGGVKLARISAFAASNGAQAAVLNVKTNGANQFLTLSPQSGTDASGNLQTTTFDDTAHFRALGDVNGSNAIYSSANAGHWFLVEIYVRLNTPGNSDGFAELWIDGVLDARCSNLNWLGSFSSFAWNAAHIERNWPAGAPAANTSYFDKLIVTDMIGGTDTPMAPLVAGLVVAAGLDSPVVSATAKQKILLPTTVLAFAPAVPVITKKNFLTAQTAAPLVFASDPLTDVDDIRVTTQPGGMAFTPIAGTFNVSLSKVPAPVALVLGTAPPVLNRTSIVQVSSGNAPMAGVAPRIIIGSIQATQAGVLALTGNAAGETAAQFITPPGQVLVLSTQAALLSFTGALAVNSGAVNLNGIAPVITRQFAPQVGAGALAFTGLQPPVVAQPAIITTPQTGTLTLVGAPPDTFVPITAVMLMVAYAPVVSVTRDRVQTKQGALSFEGSAPHVVATQSKAKHGPRTILHLVAPLFKRWF